jgi:Na+-translocating ferredoxin:NAD+ oxidoreductase RnfG subunit
MNLRLAAPFLALSLAAALPSQEEALALAFPGAALTRRELVLSETQLAQAKALAQRDPGPGRAVVYEARKDGRLVGVGFFDTHRVRTQPETVLVAIAADGRILRVEVVAFKEPLEYMARGAWVRQFDRQGLDTDLALGRGIKPLAGATLTATALTDAARRALALYRVVYGAGK